MEAMRNLARFRLPADPRWYQIGSLGLLLAYGVAALEFRVTGAAILVAIGSAEVAQWLGTRLAGLPRFDPRSALISALSLCLLLRSQSLVWIGVAAAIAVASKFLIRVRGKHVFNPTNLALVVLLATTEAAWVSPGQWGSIAFFAFLAACCGGWVIYRAERGDVTVAFLAAWAALVVGRSLWLGEPLAIPLHRLENGALLLFAFFMISDPKTLPDRRAGRVLYAAVVALGAFYVQFVLFRTNGLLWSLAASAPLVPLIDRLLPGERYEWASRAQPGRRRSRPFAVAAFGRDPSAGRMPVEAAEMAEPELALAPVAPAPRRVQAVPCYEVSSALESACPFLGKAADMRKPESALAPVAPAPRRFQAFLFYGELVLGSNRRGEVHRAPKAIETSTDRLIH